MYPKARIARHPIHPVLVAFPIALFTATLAAELAHVGTGDAFYFRAAMVANVTGVVMALLAAIPGAIDLFALPRGSTARAAGMKHAALNLFTVALFAISGAILYHDWTTKLMVNGRYVLDAHVPLAFDVVGLVSMVAAGTLGWSFVQTYHLDLGPEPEPMRTTHQVPFPY